MEEDIRNRPVARRRLLRRAGTVAAGVAGAAVATSAAASPALADPGDPLVIGANNTGGGASTTLSNGSHPNPALRLTNTALTEVEPGFTEAGAPLLLTPSGGYVAGPVGSLGASLDGTLWSSVPGVGGPVSDFVRTGGNSAVVLTFTPLRILDTRTSTPDGKASMLNGTDPAVRNQSTGQLLERAVLEVSLDSLLVFGWSLLVNVTVVGGSSAGFLTLYPGGSDLPLASNVNYNPGAIASNFAIVSLGTFGEPGQAGFVQNGINVFARTPAQVILDVCGAVVNYGSDIKGEAFSALGSVDGRPVRPAPPRVRPAHLIGR